MKVDKQFFIIKYGDKWERPYAAYARIRDLKNAEAIIQGGVDNPPYPIKGDVYFNMPAQELRYYDGVNWVAVENASN